MAKIAYILLCHKDPDAIIMQAERLTAVGDYMAIHFDARASRQAYEKIRAALDDNPNVVFAKKRVKCGWGEWSLVQASLNAVKAAIETFPKATHFYMLSGDCMAIKSAEYTHQFLDERDCDFIESFDFFESDWIKTGFKKERLIYRHLVNERKHKQLFYALFKLQKWIKLARDIPADIDVMIGSQWWCLRRTTIEKLLEFCRRRRDIMRFFRTTWIPDETFFQTLVRHLVAEQDFLFARKISPEALELKRRLGLLYAAEGVSFKISNEGRSLFKFLTGRGRIGQRFAPRFWEAESDVGRDRELMIIICKKWHVAKRLLEQIKQTTNVPAIEYVFNEENAALPDLGGIQKTLGKRTRHRRALMRMLFDFFETDRLIVCMDPGNLDLLTDFATNRSTTRMLEVQCRFDDDYLIGHARRVGLAGEQTSDETLQRLLPTIRNEITAESDRIRDAKFTHLERLKEWSDVDRNSAAISKFLSLSQDKGKEIVQMEHLFAD